MRTKSDAASFLRSLAEPSQEEPGKPPLILVRSAPEMKAFVAGALEHMDSLGNLIEKDECSPERLEQLETELADIQETATTQGCHNVAQALQLAALALALRRTWSAASVRQHRENFSGLMKNLSAMLLRLYVQGHDRDSRDELARVLGSVQRMAPLATLQVASTSADSPPEHLN